MVSLSSLIPDVKTGSITLDDGTVLTVYPLTVRNIGSLIAEFPAVNTLLANKEVKSAEFIRDAPDAFGRIALYALRVDNPADPAELDALFRLKLDALVALFNEILRVSVGKGLVPFVEDLARLLEFGGGTGTAAVTTSQPPLNT